MVQLLSTIWKYRFFWLLAIYTVFSYYDYDDLATILFFVTILDLARVLQEDEKKNLDSSGE